MLVLFWLEGVGSLFPWNAVITVTAYFDQRFVNTVYEVRPSLREP